MMMLPRWLLHLSRLSLAPVLAVPLALLLAFTLTADAQDHAHHAGVTKRGADVTGFDQTATTHHFRLLPTGGSIDVTANDPADTAAIARIRTHLQHIARMFADGVTTPATGGSRPAPPSWRRIRLARLRSTRASAAARRGMHRASARQNEHSQRVSRWTRDGPILR